MTRVRPLCTTILLAIGALIWAGGCTTKSSDKDLVMIRTDQAMDLVDGKTKMLVLGKQKGTWVDARSEADFRAGHIPGAINMPYERVRRDHKLLEDYEILIVYGHDYNDPRANGMSKRLMELDHDDVRTLIGGMRAWKAEGHPVESSQ